MTARKTICFLSVSFALIALVVFATGVVSDWNHLGPADDAHCPYCHFGHQTPAQLVAAPAVISLKPVAFLPPSADPVLIVSIVFSDAAPRAPPV